MIEEISVKTDDMYWIEKDYFNLDDFSKRVSNDACSYVTKGVVSGGKVGYNSKLPTDGDELVRLGGLLGVLKVRVQECGPKISDLRRVVQSCLKHHDILVGTECLIMDNAVCLWEKDGEGEWVLEECCVPGTWSEFDASYVIENGIHYLVKGDNEDTLVVIKFTYSSN